MLNSVLLCLYIVNFYVSSVGGSRDIGPEICGGGTVMGGGREGGRIGRAPNTTATRRRPGDGAVSLSREKCKLLAEKVTFGAYFRRNFVHFMSLRSPT